MRKSLVLAIMLVLACSMAAFAGVPDPARSGCELKGQGSSCQFRFRPDGGLDQMTVCITLRDAFDAAVPSCSTSAGIANLTANAGDATYAAEAGSALCSCASLNRGGVTNGLGVVQFVWDGAIGGRGTADVCVTAHCVGTIEICCLSFMFTSPDLNGSCDVAAAPSGVVDLGIWAGGLPPAPAQKASDYDCTTIVGVIDLGVFAGGLAASAGCP